MVLSEVPVVLPEVVWQAPVLILHGLEDEVNRIPDKGPLCLSLLRVCVRVCLGVCCRCRCLVCGAHWSWRYVIFVDQVIHVGNAHLLHKKCSPQHTHRRRPTHASHARTRATHADTQAHTHTHAHTHCHTDTHSHSVQKRCSDRGPELDSVTGCRTPTPFKVDPWLVPGGGHNNLFDTDPDGYWVQLAQFLASLESRVDA
mmetsp:Transcript_51284/g.111507  ORF Transcript_51284/g.111507 Transcript_51284/m.111507 type:complete len:200 (+) Transcript_51284:34-633(+)